MLWSTQCYDSFFLHCSLSSWSLSISLLNVPPFFSISAALFNHQYESMNHGWHGQNLHPFFTLKRFFPQNENSAIICLLSCPESEIIYPPRKILLINPYLSTDITIYGSENHFSWLYFSNMLCVFYQLFRIITSDVRFENKSLFWSNRLNGLAKRCKIVYDSVPFIQTLYLHIISFLTSHVQLVNDSLLQIYIDSI